MILRSFLLLGLVFLSDPFYAQSLQSEVLSCIGGQFEIGGSMISFTCGEAFAESSIDSLNMYSGFQQALLGNNVAVDQLEDPSSLWSVYPNPSDGQFKVSALSGLLTMEPSDVEVYDASGRLLLQMRTTYPAFLLDLTSFATGIYCVHIRSERHIERLMVVKNRL